MYHGQLGRFASRDPIRYRGGKNLHRYGVANPVAFIDAHGLDAQGTEERPNCCCCCVEDITVANVESFNGDNPVFAKSGRRVPQFGHVFDVNVSLRYDRNWLGRQNDCRLLWQETTNMPTHPGQRRHVSFPIPPTNNATLEPWSLRKKPCWDRETVILPDAPGLGNEPYRTERRYLFIVVTVESGANCPCNLKTKSVFLTQYLDIALGMIQVQKLYIGSPAQRRPMPGDPWFF